MDGSDATDLRQQLEASEARFRNIIERTADGIVIVGEDRRIRFVNAAAEHLFSRPAADLIGEDFGLPLVAGETAEMDIVQRDPGRSVIAELRVSGTTWEGEPAQLVTLRDVTDRKRADERAQRLMLERAAREQAERAGRRAAYLAEAGARLDDSLDPHATLVTLSRLVVPKVADWCVIDLLEDGTVRRIAGLHSDPSKQAILDELSRRFPPSIDSPQPSVSVLRTGTPALLRELDGEKLRSLTSSEEHVRLIEQLGARSSITVPMRVRSRVIGALSLVCAEREFDPEDVALARDLADRASQAYENARLYEAAVAASKARSDFLAVVSHELRTPLNAILGYTQLLLARITGEPDDVETEQLRRIEQNALHLLHIIQKILTFASMEAARLEPEIRAVTLRELIDEAASVAEPLAREKGLEFATRVVDGDDAIETDAGKVRQITLDLLTNAVKFTDHGSITLDARIDRDRLVIEVADTGSGIAREHLSRIFEPFWQAEGSLTRHAGGTGLGLTVSCRLARLLGGEITVESEPGRGSRFTLSVPARTPAQQDRPEPGPEQATRSDTATPPPGVTMEQPEV